MLLQSTGGVAGQLPDQISTGSNDRSPLNYFSTNESTNDIVTEGPTIFFRYYPPTANSVPNPAEIPRTIPDCDDDDSGCPINYNYHNASPIVGVSGCIQGLTEEPCRDKNCLDSLKARLGLLQQQLTLGQGQYKAEAEATERRFLSDKMSLLDTWFLDGNMALIKQTLEAYGQVDDKQLLYGFYVRQKNLTQAATVLNSLPNSTTEEIWFKRVQGVYLNYLSASTGPYIATPTDNSLLETVGTSILPVGANARAIYYLLNGIWLEPVTGYAAEAEARQSITNPVPEELTLQSFPNPANQSVVLQTSKSGGTLQVFDLFGKLLRTITINSTKMELDTTYFGNGIYLLRYTMLNGDHAQVRVVVQH